MSSASRLLASAARREVSQNAVVWRMTGGFLWVVAVVVGVGAFVGLGDHRQALLIFALALALSGAFFFTRPPAAAGTPGSHASLALIWGNTALGVVAISPNGSAAMGAALFIGPVTAMRCLRRRDAVLHLAGATAAFALAAAFSGLTPAGRAVVLCALPALWLLTAATTQVLEAIDAQADALAALARRDPLTGLGNRRLLDEALARELSRHARTERPCSVIAIDLDRFKALNDRDGHPAGDALLAEVGRALRKLVRAQDTAIRQAGDEFLIVLPDTDAAGARHLADVTRERITELGEAVGVGASVGPATFPDDGDDAGALLAAADARMRTAKGARPAAAAVADASTRDPSERAPGPARMHVRARPFNRHQLAIDPRYWWPFSLMRIGGGVLAIICALGPAGDHRTAAIVFGAVLVVLGFVTLAARPPRHGSTLAHLSLALLWGGAVLGAVVMQPAGGAAAALGMSVGPYLAVRVTSMRARSLHLAAASVAVLAAIAFGGIDEPTGLLLALMLGAWWEVAMASAVVFAAAEQQAHDLERVMHRDPLTGIGNRRMLDERLGQELARHRRTGQALAVFLLDLDGFKAINDHIGHAAGDALLRDIAGRLESGVRASDIVARHGGDEFCVVAPETTPAVAAELADQLAARVAAVASPGPPISTSVGWATFPHDGATADRLLSAADARLLEAKAERPELDWR